MGREGDVWARRKALRRLVSSRGVACGRAAMVVGAGGGVCVSRTWEGAPGLRMFEVYWS